MENDKIIVLKQFESVMDANLAKTKLDAHGIPCFLSNENIACLYPMPNLLATQARIHIFENDKDQAQEVLREE
jgi:hypothetical protein